MLLESDKHVPVFNLVFLEGRCKLQNILIVTGNFCTLVKTKSVWLLASMYKDKKTARKEISG